MYVGAFVYAKGCRLISTVPGERQNVEIFFANENGRAEQAAQEYYDHGQISGRDLFDALSTLKTEARNSRQAVQA